MIDSSSGTLLCQRKLNSTPESVIAIGEDRTFTVVAAYEKVCVISLKKYILINTCLFVSHNLKYSYSASYCDRLKNNMYYVVFCELSAMLETSLLMIFIMTP